MQGLENITQYGEDNETDIKKHRRTWLAEDMTT